MGQFGPKIWICQCAERHEVKVGRYTYNLDLENIGIIFNQAEELEKNSNQILEFTKEIKNKDEAFKIIIVEALWKIIFSDGTSDMYESNLMRRLTGLLYLDNKIVGDIKNKIKNKINK